MPGSVNIVRTRGATPTSPAVDFAMLVMGAASDSPIAAGLVSPPYGTPQALAEDYELGDGVDAACQALAKTNGNPAPPPVSFYATPDSNDGTYGSLDTSLITGTAVVTTTSGSSPLGTYQARVRVVTSGTIGTAGAVLQGSVDNGQTWLTESELGTGSTWSLDFPGETPIPSGVDFTFSPASADLTALNTLINEIYTDFNAHVILVGGSPVHGSTGLVDVVSIASATNTATRVARINALRTAYIAHIGRVSGSPAIHLGQDVTAGHQLAYAAATDDTTALMLALDLKAKYNLHIGSTTYHTNGDATNVVTSAAPSMGSLLAGDEWSVPTRPPTWNIGDIYTGGSTPAGALAAVATCSQNFGLLVLTEPVIAGDIATLTLGLDYITSVNAARRPSLLVRFRDPTAGETDAAYILAVRAFVAALASDARISCVAGNGYLTDALRGYVYKRSGLPALLARLQSCAVIPGALGEKLAQHPGYGARGPLEGFTLLAPNGALYGHDERVRGGIDGPIAGKGGGITFYQEHHDELAGTYVSQAPCLYPVGSTVLTLMDSRVASGIECALYAVGFSFLQGADVFDPDTLELDVDIREAMAGKAMAAIRAKYSTEIQNANDPNLVTVNPTITVDGSQVTVFWEVTDRLFGYTNTVTIFHKISR